MAKKYYQDNFGQYTGNTPLDAYNFYKKNEQSAQNIISPMNFQSAQQTSANIGQSVMPPQDVNPQTTNNKTSANTILGMNKSLLTGLFLGAGVALVATNPKVQKAVIGGATKVWTNIQASIEEMKEQVEDAKAELAQED